MSGLVDPADIVRVREFPGRPKARPTNVAVADPFEAERAALRLEVERLSRALLTAAEDADATVSRAREEGLAAGRKESVERADARTRLLQDALGRAVKAFETRLDVLDGLSPALVRAALEKLLGDATNWTALSEAMVARHLGTLRRSSVVSVCVSPEDYRDAGDLRGLEVGGHRIVLDPQLRAGACRIECKLGQLDLDVRQQWSELASLLEAMETA